MASVTAPRKAAPTSVRTTASPLGPPAEDVFRAPQPPAVADAQLAAPAGHPQEEQSPRGPLEEDGARVEADHSKPVTAPPSTCNAAPVMKAAGAEQRKATTRPKSAG